MQDKIQKEIDLTVKNLKEIKIIEFTPGHNKNPFNNYRIQRLREILSQLQNDHNTKTIILYGGKNNSFCSGGDFNEISKFTGGEDVKEWIENVTKTYISVLSSKIPIIAAIDDYAIGLGLQLALLCDYRIGSEKAKLQMPELKKGIACNFGALILEHMIGRPLMQKMVFKCDMVTSEDAKTYGLIHDITQSDNLIDAAIELAKNFAQYPETAVKETKITMNKELIEKLNNIKGSATLAHCSSFSKGIAQGNMRMLLSKNHINNSNENTDTIEPSKKRQRDDRNSENEQERLPKKICISKSSREDNSETKAISIAI